MVNMYESKLTWLQQGIIRLLFVKSGMSLNQRRIAKMLNVSQPAVRKALPLLEKKGFIKLKQDKESKRWAIELNRDNHQVAGLKCADNLKQIYEVGLAKFLWESFPGCTVILFGSYSRGEDITTSDIDIAIIGSKEKEINLTKFDKLLEREIIINFYSSFKEIHKHLRDSILNGILLSGSIDL